MIMRNLMKNTYLKITIIICLLLLYFYLSDLLLAATSINVNVFLINYGNIFLGLLLYLSVFLIVPFILKKYAFIVYASILFIANILIAIAYLKHTSFA